MEGSASFLSGIKSYFWGPEIKPLEIFPRKAANLFDDDRKVKPLLPSTYAEFVGGFSPHVKHLEYNFYPDLATKRTVTAVVTAIKGGKPVPLPDKDVFWRIGSGSAPNAKIQKNVSTSDANGCAELVVEHPVETPPIGQRTIKIQASFYESFQEFSEIILRVHRNEDVLADLNPLLTGRSLLVYQKEKPEASEGVKRLQHLLNQVVARKKSCTDFQWIKFDGKYDATVKKVVAAFISKFGGGFDYKKGQFNVKVNEQLQDYIKQEYGKYEEGCLVDRSLLIGDKLWDDSQPVSKIDGLLDIYNGVVERFFAQMLARAEEYTSCNTFWLHRPIHRPYKQGQIEQVRMKNTVDLRTKAGDDQAIIKDKTGNAEQAKKGQTLKFLADSSVKITHWHYVEAIAKVTGWVSEDDVSEDGTTKVKFKNTATIYDGTTSQKKAQTDSNENTIKVAAGTTVKRTAKKKVSGKWWYQVLLLQKAGWTSSEASKLSKDKKKVEITKSTTIREKSTDSSDAIEDWKGNEMKPSSGNKFTYLKKSTPATEGWYQIENKNGVAGWVPAKECLPFSNDRVIAENAGTFGMPGVAYSYGSKDRPAEFTSFLNSNPKQPRQLNAGMSTRILIALERLQTITTRQIGRELTVQVSLRIVSHTRFCRTILVSCPIHG